MIKKFEEFINERLWTKGIERSKSNQIRKGDIVVVNTTNELIDAIKDAIAKSYINKTEIVDLNFIDTSNITDMHDLFLQVDIPRNKVINIDVSKWDVSNVKNMNSMFYLGAYNSISIKCDLSEWNVSNVTNMRCMFYCCSNFNSDLSKWDVSNVKNMSNMFKGCEHFNSDLSEWDVSNVKDMRSMFYDCKDFNCDLTKWDHKLNKPKVTNMFFNCNSLEKIPDWYDKYNE